MDKSTPHLPSFLALTLLAGTFLSPATFADDQVQCKVGQAFMTEPDGWEFVQQKLKAKPPNPKGTCHLLPTSSVDTMAARASQANVIEALKTPGIHLIHYPKAARLDHKDRENQINFALGGALDKPRLRTNHERLADTNRTFTFYSWQEGVRPDGTKKIGMARVFSDTETGSLWIVISHEPEGGWSQEELLEVKAAFTGVKLYDYRQRYGPAF